MRHRGEFERAFHGTGLRADKVHSVDHLMRLPGSTNFMTKSKREKGYPEGERLARIVEWHPEHVYRLLDLPTLPEVAPSFPFFNEFGYEIASRFNSKDVTRFIRKGKPEISCSKLIASFYFIIIPHKVFTQGFHIMYIETHHMAKTVRHKKRMSSGSNGLINISFHQVPNPFIPDASILHAIK